MQSALDRLPPSLLATSRTRVVDVLSPKSLYGRGPHTLKHSAVKRFALGASALVACYALITASLLCWYRGFCFAEEATGSGGAGSRLTYSTDASRAVVPLALALLLLVAPAAVAAARLQLPWLVVTAWLLAGLACVFFSVAAVATLALLGNGGVVDAAARAWAATPALSRELLFPGGLAQLEQAMRGDAAAVGIAALAGAAATGLLALAVFPLGRVVLWAVTSVVRGWWAARMTRARGGGSGDGGASPPATDAELDLRALCCALGPDALAHDAAAAAADEGVVLACGPFRYTLCAPRAAGAPAAGAAGSCLWASALCAPARCLAGTPASAATAAALDVAGGCCGSWTRAALACCLLGCPRRGLLPASSPAPPPPAAQLPNAPNAGAPAAAPNP
jgi:hypothetical protein